MKFDFTSDSFSPKFSAAHSIQTVVCDRHSPLSYAVAHLQHNHSCCTPLQHTMEHSAMQKATYFHAWPPGHELLQCIPSRKNLRALVSLRSEQILYLFVNMSAGSGSVKKVQSRFIMGHCTAALGGHCREATHHPSDTHIIPETYTGNALCSEADQTL